jgi:hypothetical protein
MTKKDSLAKLFIDNNAFLIEQEFLLQRVKQGIQIYPPELVGNQFEAIAKTINPSGDYHWKGCNSCIMGLVKFVYESRERFAVDEVTATAQVEPEYRTKKNKKDGKE